MVPRQNYTKSNQYPYLQYRLCPYCYLPLFHNEFKSYHCKMKSAESQVIHNRKCCFDIECCYDSEKMDSFKPILVMLEFETVCFGNTLRIIFGDKKLISPKLNLVEKNVAQFDYCADVNLPNLLAPMKLNHSFRSRSRCWPENEQGSKP